MNSPTFLPLAVIASLLLGGCATGPHPQPEAQSAVEASFPVGFESYYTQTVDWGPCDPKSLTTPMGEEPKNVSSYQCATLSAPMNWDDPDSDPIELGIARHLNRKGESAPALFYNLGGPGGGAIDSLASVVTNVFTQALVNEFQVVALDPRGIGKSTPIVCMTDEERDEEAGDAGDGSDTSSMTAEEIVQQASKDVADFGNQCLERNGEILGFVDSDSATRDFDMARAVLGQPKFDYLGFSYGTVLGALYADLFPETTGNLVLDGAVDMALDTNQLSAAQLEGMENSLYHWIEVCQATRACPLKGDLESGKKELRQFFDEVEKNPIPTADPDRDLNANLLRTAVIGSLYSTQMYPMLTQGLSMAMRGDGSFLLFLADYFNSRGDDGIYWDNSSDAFVAVNFLDYEPVGTVEQWQAESERLADQFPLLGDDFGYGSAGMDQWPVKSRFKRHEVHGKGAGDILVIGTTHDPATPYFMAEDLAGALEGGVLVTVEGWDHTAYNRDADPCIRNAVDNFLLKGRLPEAGLTCAAN